MTHSLVCLKRKTCRWPDSQFLSLFVAWNAIAAIGGLILFVYIMHTIVMALVSIAVSPADTLTFGSARQYSVV
jgi:hypothetical protein